MSGGGFWNRAGRRSGGYRPVDLGGIAVPQSLPCGHSHYPAELHRVVSRRTARESALCPTCNAVVWREDEQGVRTYAEPSHG